jgi:hypothetical protein
MRVVEEYRKRAEECAELAKLALTSGQRTVILNIADTWESLVKSREGFLRAHPSQSDEAALPWRDPGL